MSFFRFFLFFTCLFLPRLTPLKAQSALAQRIDFEVKRGEALPDVLLRLSSKSGLIIGFSDELFKNAGPAVPYQAQNEKTNIILDRVLQNTGLGWRLVNGQVLLYKAPPPDETISGYVEDAESGERLPGARISHFVSGRYTIANDYGFFSIKLPGGASSRLLIAMPGYESVYLGAVSSKHLLHVKLRISTLLDEVVINADSSSCCTNFLMPSGIEITGLPLGKMPGPGGEPDILRAMTATQPGITSGTDGFGGISVRGGETDHNLVLLDDATIFYPTHGLGLFSVINPDVVRSTWFYKSDAPARFGSRMGSVMDVRTREGNLYRPSASASVSWIAARLSVEFPIVKEKGAVLISARRSLLGPVLQHFSEKNKKKDEKTGYSNYHFADLNAKLNWIFNAKDRLYLSYYEGRDQFIDRDTFVKNDIGILMLDLSVANTANFFWKNRSAALRWNRLWSDQCFSNTTLTGSSFYLKSNNLNEYNFFGTKLEIATVSQSKVEEVTFKNDTEWYVSENHTISSGFAISGLNFRPFVYQGLIDTTQGVAIDVNGAIQVNQSLISQKGINAALYAGHGWRLPAISMQINTGVRAEWFGNGHGRAKLIPQPRLQISQKLGKQFFWMASGGFFAQSVRSASLNGIETVNDFWLLSGNRLPLQKSWQASAGPGWNKGVWTAKTQIFVKSMLGLDEYKPAELLTDTSIQANEPAYWPYVLAFGKGKSTGVEFSIQCVSAKTWFSSAYTYSVTSRQYGELNNGVKFAPRFDRRHDFKVSAIHHFTQNLSASANWSLASGDVVSTLVFLEGVGKIRFLDLNQTAGDASRIGYGDLRQPLQHRLDVAVNWEWNRQRVKHRLALSLYNVYNQPNRYYTFLVQPVAFTIPPPEPIVNKINGLPFLPGLSWNVVF